MANMESRKIEIIKRNRKFFAAKVDGYCPCKVVIDENSESLELGEHLLHVEDASIRTKFGTDVIFRLAASVEEQKQKGVVTVRPESAVRNSRLQTKIHELGGRWDAEARAWVFPAFVADAVENLDFVYNTDFVPVEIEFLAQFSWCCGPAQVLGFNLAAAAGRDSGARMCTGVSLLSGAVKSGGSVKNWQTIVEEGSVMRLMMPRELLRQEQDTIDEDIKIRVLE